MSSAAHGPGELDEQGLNAFIVARGLLERAELTIDGTAPGAIAAFILYDVAVETAAKAALRLVQPSQLNQDRLHLPTVLNTLRDEYRQLSVDDGTEWRAHTDARQLHEERNRVQHHGTIPSPDDLARAQLRARDFISALVSIFFGRQISELSRARLVRDKEVRAAIEAAERNLAAGELNIAVQHLSIAFEMARQVFRSGQPYDYRKPPNITNPQKAARELTNRFAALEGGRRPLGLWQLEQLLEGLVRRLELAEDRLEALSLGAQPSDYVWFRNRFPKAVWNTESDRWDTIRPAFVPLAPATRREVIRGLDFVTTVALHWQQFPDPGPDEEVGA